MENLALFWLIGGIVALLLELLIPGFVIVFFGLGALITAFCAWIFDISLAWQLVIFISSSVALLLAFRKLLQKKFFAKSLNPEDELEHEFVGKSAIAATNFINNKGKVEFNGTHWNAFSESLINKGDDVIITKRDNLLLFVTKL